jgi:predicted dehydrogenase
MREKRRADPPQPGRPAVAQRDTVVSDRRKVGVIGAGLISQAMHLPHLALLRDRFELAVVADPSPTVRERVGDRFGIPARVATASEAIAHPGLHGVVIGTPNATHAADRARGARAGLDVFVEKPLAISLEDVDAIVEAQRSSERVVQVGYNNRFDRSYARLVDELPGSAERLRYVSVLMHDPEFGPYFGPRTGPRLGRPGGRHRADPG